MLTMQDFYNCIIAATNEKEISPLLVIASVPLAIIQASTKGLVWDPWHTETA